MERAQAFLSISHPLMLGNVYNNSWSYYTRVAYYQIMYFYCVVFSRD